MATDPVCNMNVDEGSAAATSSYNGTTYYFCAEGCKTSFENEPEKYVKGTGTGGCGCSCAG